MAGTRVKIKQSAVVGKVPSAGSLVQGELALNTADRKLYSKDGNGSIFEISGGASGGANTAAQILKYEFIPTLGQTIFPVTYNVVYDYVNVYYNGVKLPDVDYTATSGTDIVLGVGANLITDIITIELTKSITLHGGSRIDDHEFIASAGQIVFPMSYDVIKDNLEVYVNGIKLHSIDYTATNNTSVDLTDPADVDDEVTVRHIQAIALATVVNQTATDGSAILPAGTTAERDATPIAGYLRWNTDLNSTEVFNGSTSTWDKVGFIDSEQIEDIVGAMVDANTETNIAVTYNDTSGKLNFGVTGLAISDTTGLQTALDGKVDDAQVLTNVPAGALFTDTIYTHPANHSISFITGLQTALDGKVDDAQVLTNVPTGALFTDTTYTVGDGGLTEKNFTITLKNKLDGIADSANNYTHPGAHAISFITGLQTALDGKVDDSQVLTNVPVGALFTDTETTTSLSINANILKYTDEVGAATNIDLSLYLDDTNLARLTTGTLNGSTGIATFSRDDSSTFTVDFSALLDDTQVTVNNTLTSTSTTQALSAAQGKVLQDGKVANSRVLTDVPTGALFTDTVYTHPANHTISVITGLQTALDGKVDDAQVLTNVPTGALFTDTVYSHPATHTIGEVSGLQSALDAKTTPGYVDTAIANLVDSAPATLDTLNELATALGDDANHVTTMTTLIGTKADTGHTHSYLPLSGGTVTGDITAVKFYGDGSNLTGVSSDNWYVDALAYDAGTSTLTIGRNGGLADLTTTITAGMEHFNQSANPTSPTLGDTWYDTTDGTIYKYINDGSSSVWVDISTAGAGDALPDQTPNAGKYLTTNGTDPAWDEMGIDNVTGLQTALDTKTTPGYVDTAISNLIGAAPAALDTLQELGDALGDDANYAATITSALAGKFDKTGGTVTGNVTANIFYGDGSNLTGISTDNFYADALTFSGGVLTVGRNGGLADLTVNLDGRYDQHYNQGTAPTSPTIGDGWYDTTDGTFYKYINDGTNNLWVDISTAGAGGQDIDWTEVLNKPSSFTPSVHTHVAADVTDLDSFVDTKIGAVIDAAPANLDTLNELAQALGDDANFASTVTNSLSGKVDDSQVLTDVPSGAVFTDTVYSLPAVLPAIDGSQLTGIESATKSASNPAIDTNGTLGDQWINTTTGEMFILKDATTDANEWEGQEGSEVAPIPPFSATANFNTVLYTGNATAGNAITGAGFQPDFVWVKVRSSGDNNLLFDSVRGATKLLYSDTSAAEMTNTSSLTSFDSDGFTLGTWQGPNWNGQTFAAWCWKAGGASVSNSDGSITTTVSANADAGFSIIKYTGNYVSGATLGHGLDSAPELIFIKRLNTADSWVVVGDMMHTSSPWNDYYLYLDSNSNVMGSFGTTNNIPPTSSVITISSNGKLNASGDSYLAYAWHSVAGYSKMSSYSGTGGANTITTGFHPRYVMIKSLTMNEQWLIFDSARGSTTGVFGEFLYADTSSAEINSDRMEFFSTGFKLSTGHDNVNNSSATYIYMAFA